MKKCIWCLTEKSDMAEEHIIPEALGCPKNFVFTDGTVCRSCNNNLGHVDQAVINDFDIMSFYAGVKRKGNKQPKISSRGNVTGGFDKDEKFIFFNMGKDKVKDPSGITVSPYKGGERHIRANLQKIPSSPLGNISGSVKFATSKKFRRGIYKIALSSIAYFLDKNKALDSSFNSVREFVTKGKGDRTIFMRSALDKDYTNQVWPPYSNKEGHYSVAIRLAYVEFLTDLSPNQSLTPIFMEAHKNMYEDHEWTFVPNK